MKLLSMKFSILFLFITKIVLQLYRVSLDRNFYKIDDILNSLIILFILYAFYIQKENVFKKVKKDNNWLFSFTLITTTLIFVLRTIFSLPYSFINTDNIIWFLSVNRMVYFDLNAFSSTWNEHTTLLAYTLKVIVQFLNYFDLGFGISSYFIIFLLLSATSFFLLLKVLAFYTNSLEIRYIISTIYFLDLVASGNRTIRFDQRFLGSLLLLIFLYNFLSYMNTEKFSYLHICVIVGTLIIFNQESYSLTVLLFFITYLYIMKPTLLLISKLFLTFSLSTLVIIFFHLQSGQLSELWNLNILFHLNSSRNQKVNIFSAISGVEFFPSINIYLVLFFIWLFFSYINPKLLKRKEILILNAYIIGEIFHLFLTGPRWIAYGQIFRVPLMIVLCVLLNKYIQIIKIERVFENLSNKWLILIIFPFLVVTFIGGPNSYDRKIQREQSILDIVDVRDEVQIEIFEYSQTKSYFLWTENKNWSWMYLEADLVPATRMWLWMQAYEEKKSYFSWENDRWGYEKIREYWLKDIKTENTNLFIVDTNFIPLPDFVHEYLKNNTELTKCISSYCIYKK